MNVDREGLERDIVRIIHQHSALRGEKAHRIAKGVSALLAEAREEGEPQTRAERKATDALMSDDEYELRKFIAFAHQDGKCHIYGDDGELQCSDMLRHGRTIDFRREPIPALLEVIYTTRLREYAESQKTPPALLAEAREEGKPVAPSQEWEEWKEAILKERVNLYRERDEWMEKAKGKSSAPAANTEGLLAQLVDALRSVEWSSAWIDKEEVVSMTREICPYCDYKKADGHQQGCKVGDALDAALRGTGEGEPPDPDLNADGPAERAHRQDEARRMK